MTNRQTTAKPLKVLLSARSPYQELLKTIPTLNENYAEVLYLKYFCELSNAEIAQLLDISYKNVSVRLHRAKNKLKALLLGE